jgi:hypothetical protein
MMRTHCRHEGQAKIPVADRRRTAVLNGTALEAAASCGEQPALDTSRFSPDFFNTKPFLATQSGIAHATAAAALLCLHDA